MVHKSWKLKKISLDDGKFFFQNNYRVFKNRYFWIKLFKMDLKSDWMTFHPFPFQVKIVAFRPRMLTSNSSPSLLLASCILSFTVLSSLRLHLAILLETLLTSFFLLYYYFLLCVVYANIDQTFSRIFPGNIAWRKSDFVPQKNYLWLRVWLRQIRGDDPLSNAPSRHIAKSIADFEGRMKWGKDIHIGTQVRWSGCYHPRTKIHDF